jgi:biopolymer transport protein ExbB/TolQ
MTAEEIQQLEEAVQQGNWLQVILCSISILLFIITTIYAVTSKIQTLKIRSENEKLLATQAKSENDFKERELALKKQYTDDLAEIKKTVLNRVDENAKKSKEETEAKAVKINEDIASAQKSLDQILNETK